jgi:hypothetical protein
MDQRMDATTVRVDTFNVATPEVDAAVATPDQEGVVDMDSRRGGQSRTPAKKAGGQKSSVAKTPVAKTTRGQKAAPAKKAPAKKAAAAAPADQSVGSVADLLARLPEAGAGVPEDKKGPRSFHISTHWLERARAAVYWLGQTDVDEPTNVSELADLALRKEVERLERTYNGGRPFKAVQGKMKTGPGAEGVARLSEYQDRRRGEGRRGPGDEGGHGS